MRRFVTYVGGVAILTGAVALSSWGPSLVSWSTSPASAATSASTGRDCPAYAPSAGTFSGGPGDQLVAGPSSAHVCGYSNGLPLKGRPAGGVELGAGPAEALVSILDGAPPAGEALSTCKDKAPSVLLLFNYQRHADVDVAVVDFGCPSSRSSSPAASPAVVFFGQYSRAIGPGLDSTLVADAGSYGVPRPPVTPDVFGETAAQATKTASAHAFALAFGGEEVDPLYAAGTVLLQFPPAGMGDIGNQVDVILSAPISPPCTAADLVLSYEGYQGAAGSYAAGFLVRNVSARSCLLAGPMKLTGTDLSGHPATGTAELTAPAGSVLSAGAAPWPPGGSPPVGDVFGTLAVSSPDYCPGRAVVPALWRLSVGRGTLGVANSLRGKAFPTCGGALSTFGTFSIG